MDESKDTWSYSDNNQTISRYPLSPSLKETRNHPVITQLDETF